jgi:hypothetical protein
MVSAASWGCIALLLPPFIEEKRRGKGLEAKEIRRLGK